MRDRYGDVVGDDVRTRRSPRNQDRLFKALGQEKAPVVPCEWEETADGQWETDCGNIYEFSDGTPDANGHKFCCFCGKPLKQVPYVEEGEA